MALGGGGLPDGYMKTVARDMQPRPLEILTVSSQGISPVKWIEENNCHGIKTG